MGAPIGFRHQQVDVLAEDFFGQVSEHPLGSLAECFDMPAAVDDDDRIDGCVKECPQLLFGARKSTRRRCAEIRHSSKCRVAFRRRAMDGS